MGKWIVLEGVDKSGKTTVVDMVARELQEQGFSVLTDQWLGGLSLATQKIRQILVYDPKIVEDPELSLEWAAALNMIKSWRYKQLCDEYDYIISDRGPLSTLVYQGYEQENGIEKVRSMLDMIDFRPDLTVLIDIDFATFKSRGKAHKDNWESDETVTKLIKGYHSCLDLTRPSLRVDGSKSVESLSREILTQIRKFE